MLTPFECPYYEIDVVYKRGDALDLCRNACRILCNHCSPANNVGLGYDASLCEVRRGHELAEFGCYLSDEAAEIHKPYFDLDGE